MTAGYHGPGHLRPPERPGLVRALGMVAVLGTALTLLGAPVWWLMHGAAVGWSEDRAVVAVVGETDTCRTGPPPGTPRTCAGAWVVDGERTEGEVSDRYGGTVPERAGAEVEGRLVDATTVYAGFHPLLLRWALLSPWLSGAGLALLAGGVLGLIRHDPRWGSSRTDLPPPG